MALETLTERPLLGAAEIQPNEFENPPVSRLAIIAFIFGLFSSLATVGYALLPVAIIAIALGLLVYWQLSRDPSHGGKTLAIAGLGLGCMFATWALTATYLRDQYMYRAGAEIALHFLQTLSGGDRYEAYELTRPEVERQIAGTSLERVYNSGSDQTVRQAFQEFANSDNTRLVQSRGENATWRFVRGTGVSRDNQGRLDISLEMVDDSKQPAAKVKVVLQRDPNSANPAKLKAPTATWYVRQLTS